MHSEWSSRTRVASLGEWRKKEIKTDFFQTVYIYEAVAYATSYAWHWSYGSNWAQSTSNTAYGERPIFEFSAVFICIMLSLFCSLALNFSLFFSVLLLLSLPSSRCLCLSMSCSQSLHFLTCDFIVYFTLFNIALCRDFLFFYYAVVVMW